MSAQGDFSLSRSSIGEPSDDESLRSPAGKRQKSAETPATVEAVTEAMHSLSPFTFAAMTVGKFAQQGGRLTGAETQAVDARARAALDSGAYHPTVPSACRLADDLYAERHTSMEVEESGAAASSDDAGGGSGSDEDEGAPTPKEPRAIDLKSKLKEPVARAILGLPTRGDVTMEDVGRKFKALALVWHPDKSDQPKDKAKEVFQRINAAKRYMLSIISGDQPSQGEGAENAESEAENAESEAEGASEEEADEDDEQSDEEGEPSVQLFEKVDVAKLNAIIAAWPALEIRHKYSADDWRQMYEKLVRYSKRARADGTVEVVYSQAPYRMGRFYARGGWALQNMPRWLRHTLARLFLSDIDIKNCHPRNLVQWIEKAGKQVPPVLGRYAGEDRDAMLGELMATTGWERDEAKDFVIMVINGGRGDKWAQVKGLVPAWVRALMAEIRTIFRWIEELEQAIAGQGRRNHEAKCTEEPDKPHSLIGSVVSLLCQEIEVMQLRAMLHYLQEEGVVGKMAVLMHDGLGSPKVEEEELPGLMRQMEAAVETATGYRVRLVHKPMDEGIEISKAEEDPWFDTTKVSRDEAQRLPPLGRGLRFMERTWQEVTEGVYSLHKAVRKLEAQIKNGEFETEEYSPSPTAKSPTRRTSGSMTPARSMRRPSPACPCPAACRMGSTPSGCRRRSSTTRCATRRPRGNENVRECAERGPIDALR